MYRNRLLLLLLALLTAGASHTFAQGKNKKTSRDRQKLITQLRADVSYLASDSLQGRRTGSEGERLAADYLIARYRQLHIPALKSDYRLPFSFTYGREVGSDSYIRINGTQLSIPGEAFPIPASGRGHAAATTSPEIMEVESIWLRPLFANPDDANNPHFDWEQAALEQAREARQQGATALVLYSTDTRVKGPAFNYRSEYTEPADIPIFIISASAWQKLTELNPGGEYAIDLNAAVEATPRAGNNVAAYIDNGAPLTVVLGAHYDHLGMGEDGSSLHGGHDPEIHNGADDNASGTAALLALAARIKKDKLKKYNYLFIHFSGEELGLLGSKAIVKDAGLDSSRIAWMLNMDMVGRLNDSTRALTLGGIGTSPSWAWAYAEAGRSFKVVADSSGVGPSDHTSFYHAGVPVLFLFTGVHPDYHKPSDDADRINYAGMADVIEYTYSVVRHMDQQPRPVFQRTTQSTVGRVRFKVTLGVMPDYSYNDGDGLRIDGVTDGKPAAEAGLQAGDIITHLGTVEVRGIQSYMEALAALKSGETANLIFRRGKETKTVQVKL